MTHKDKASTGSELTKTCTFTSLSSLYLKFIVKLAYPLVIDFNGHRNQIQLLQVVKGKLSLLFQHIRSFWTPLLSVQS